MKKDSKKIEKTDKIDALAIIVKHGFDRVEEKFEKLEHKVDKIEHNLGQKIDQLEIKVDRIENLILGRHDRRLDVIEDKLRQIVTVLNIK